jgi:hypothetical protein
MQVRIPRSFVPRHLSPCPLVLLVHCLSNSLYLHISTAKSNDKTSLQRTPLCNLMKVGSLLPEIGEGGLGVIHV